MRLRWLEGHYLGYAKDGCEEPALRKVESMVMVFFCLCEILRAVSSFLRALDLRIERPTRSLIVAGARVIQKLDEAKM